MWSSDLHSGSSGEIMNRRLWSNRSIRYVPTYRKNFLSLNAEPHLPPTSCWYYIVRTCSYRHTFLYLYIFTTPQVASDPRQLNMLFSCNQLSLIVFPHTIYCHKLRTTFVKLISVSLRERFVQQFLNSCSYTSHSPRTSVVLPEGTD